jgi:AraC-like DNA-binding protein
MTETPAKYLNHRIDIPPEFAGVFTHFYFAKNSSSECITRTLLPSFQTIMIFSFAADVLLHTNNQTQISLQKCLILGPIKQAFDYSLPANSEILVVNFKDDAFYRFFGPLCAETNVPTSPDELLNENCFTAMWHELKPLNDTTSRVNYILDFCRPYLDKRHLLAEQLLSLRKGNSDPIKTLAHISQKSERTVQTQHKKYFGYTAKEVKRYQRFLTAIELIQKISDSKSAIDWFEIIDECGYYDQSHFIHDFKHYLNLSPSQYLQFQQDICNPIRAC